MALAGHDTAYLVFNVTSTATVRSGTLTGVVAGERVVAVLAIDGNTNTQDPSTYTVTLGSDTLSHIVSNTTTLNEGFSAIFSGVATASGDQTLSVTTPNSTRAMACHAFRITGFDTTTPHPNSGQTKPGSNSTSLTSPNGVTTAADGNAEKQVRRGGVALLDCQRVVAQPAHERDRQRLFKAGFRVCDGGVSRHVPLRRSRKALSRR